MWQKYMALWDSEGGQLIIEMVIGSAGALVGLWYLKKRTKDREAAKGSADQSSSSSSSPPPSSPPSPP
ncbi:MAG TPA: hypothetical protein VHA09_00185 [Nitrososphaera sp.]|nr:hypothetical protein [Nitrososphaera sp.]